MRFNIIVAIDRNRGIGINNKIPWNFRQDLSYFKNLTKGAGDNAIIMGKNTYLSLNRPLPHRDNIVLSSSLESIDKSAILCKNMKQLFDYLTNKNDDKITPKSRHDKTDTNCNNKNVVYDDIWIIGGSVIYKQFLDMPEYINKIYITEVDNVYDCDTFFPELPHYYKLENTSVTSENSTVLTFNTYNNKYVDSL